MRTALLVVLALAVSVSAAWATVSQDDGWSGNPSPGFGGELTGPDPEAYQRNWVQVGGSQSWQGWWDGDDGKWIPASGTGDTGLKVTAYVELYASQSQETEAVFHWGQPPFQAMAALLSGTVVSNHPCWVGIRKDGWQERDQDKANHLSFVKDFWNRSGPLTAPVVLGVSALGDTTADIPLTWEMRVVGGDGNYYPMTWTGGVGSANWGWYSNGRLPVGTTQYRIKITATPNPYQADGKYELDPEVVVVPDL